MAATDNEGARKPTRPTCFIAMPVSTRKAEAERYEDPDHWLHVHESLFIPAVDAADFEPIRPQAKGSHLIHGTIIRHLSEADLVLCDLSSQNPNVFFELGVRTSLNRPIALVRDEHTELPFDTSGINTHTYSSALRGWEVEAERASLHRHLEESASSCAGENPLWRQFGLTIRAEEPDTQASPLEAKVDLLADRLSSLQALLDDGHSPRFGHAGAAIRHSDEVPPMNMYSEVPADRFLTALDRVRPPDVAGPLEIELRTPFDVRLVSSSGWSPLEVDVIRSLAKRHGVRVTFESRHGARSEGDGVAVWENHIRSVERDRELRE